jgi:hypothetical protein
MLMTEPTKPQPSQNSEVLLLQRVKTELAESKTLQEAQERIEGLIELASAISLVQQNQKQYSIEELQEEAFKREQEKDKLAHFICQKFEQVKCDMEKINDFWLKLYEGKPESEALKIFSDA